MTRSPERSEASSFAEEVMREARQISTKTSFTDAERRRMSGPGLRAWKRMAEFWQLDATEVHRALGLDESDYARMSAAASACDDGATPDHLLLPGAALVRLSALLGVWKGLRLLVGDHAAAAAWLRTSNRGQAFAGRAPLEMVLDPDPAGAMTVKLALVAVFPHLLDIGEASS